MPAELSEKSIFLDALGKSTPAERDAFVAEACAGDESLRNAVEALLNAHQKDDHLLDQPVGKLPGINYATTLGDARESLEDGDAVYIDSYRLREQIGEGGFGLVYVAEQQEPVRRKVALKIIKPGMDDRNVIARFEAERQALAMMDHPNIAHVLGAGATKSGRPYFVMELVRGIPITDFCDKHHLDTDARLNLFMSVCRAVQHAHQKGVIHRDLKPSNVLVTMHDATPVAKVIDFGVSKAIGQNLTDKTIYTHFTAMVGTPLYMSPEQAGMSGLDIDTRSDIYSLGVLLYELVTGTTPLDRERIESVEFDELRRIIREEEPPRPSTRLTTMGQRISTISAQRHV
ncbi:MAG: serine/threonine protein kinase, partial [bacterium]|nr:serine/threonine protein kinase [bacterium]